MDGTGAYYTEWSKPQRKTPIQYTNAYIWNLERWFFLFFNLLMWHITWIHLWLLNHPCILELNPTWHGVYLFWSTLKFIFLIFCWWFLDLCSPVISICICVCVSIFDKSRQHIKKQRHYFATKGPYSQSYGFSSSLYGCESWTIKKAEQWRTDAFELWCWRLLRVPWTARS